MTLLAVTLLLAGASLRIVYVVAAGYCLLMFAILRSRTLLRAIDSGDLPGDGRVFASFAWMLGMVGSGLAILAFGRALF